MLDRCMEENANTSPAELSELESDFKTRLELANELFGDHVFRYEDENKKWQLSKPLFDGIMVALDRLWARRDLVKSRKTKVVRNVARLLGTPSAFEVIIGKPNTAKAVLRRTELLLKALKG